MLYTLSQANYDQRTLNDILAQLTENDALLLWQDGVLQAVKNRECFANRSNVFVSKPDCIARNIQTDLHTISLTETVKLTEHYFPQIAL